MNVPRAIVVSLVALSLLEIPAGARAGDRYDLVESEELTWVGIGLGLSAGATWNLYRVEPAREPGTSDPAGIHRFDRSLMQPYREDHVGDAMATASFAFPFSLLGRSDARDDSDELAMMWLEAALINHGLVTLAKSLAQRERPLMYDPDAPAALKTKRSARLSFYSGHAAWSAMNCMYTATVFSDYSSDRDSEIAVWAGAVIYSAFTGFRRVDTGHHFATDVIAGFVAGAAIGYIVPALHRADEPAPGGPVGSATPQTLRIGASFSF
jgi:membrane-associated phospholipid phosphatase